jgi:hypothetical protein
MPFQMIAKVAESFALRKAFNDKLTGLHIPEEMAAFNDENNGAILNPEQEEELEEAYALIKQNVNEKKNVDDLFAYYRKELKDNSSWKNDTRITAMFKERKIEIMGELNPNVSNTFDNDSN